jgi:hypothetical protein
MPPQSTAANLPMPNRAAYGTDYPLFYKHYLYYLEKVSELKASARAAKQTKPTFAKVAAAPPPEENREDKKSTRDASFLDRRRGKRRAYRKRKYLRELDEQAKIASKVASIEASNARIMAAQHKAVVTQRVTATKKGTNSIVPVSISHLPPSGWTTVTRKGKGNSRPSLPTGLAPASLGLSGGSTVRSFASVVTTATTQASSVPSYMAVGVDPSLAKLNKEVARLRKERDASKAALSKYIRNN